MADLSAHLQHRNVESASSTTDDTHEEIILTVQPEVKYQTLSTTTTTVKIILGLLSAAVLVALVVAVVNVADVVMNQQHVPELKEKIHSLQEMTPELQTIMDKVAETVLNQPPPATTVTITSATVTITSTTAPTSSDVVDLDLKSSCAAIHTHLPDSASGVYLIYPGGRAPGRSVWCDMETDGGGWTRFQRRYDGSVLFSRTWAEYQHGFGFPQSEFWLGNDDLHRLTTAQPSELRVDLWDWDGIYGQAKYSQFSVGSSSTNYRLDVDGHSGNISDALAYHISLQFSTKDRDNDGTSNSNCATSYGGDGGWWYGNCHSANLNGRYVPGGVFDGRGVFWTYSLGVSSRNTYSYKAAAMLTRPRH